MVYLDYNASSLIPEDLKKDLDLMMKAGFVNPSSLHRLGRAARKPINDAAEALATFVDCDSEFVYWTSGAAESNSWAIHSAVHHSLHRFGPNHVPRILVSAIEHESVLMSLEWLRSSVFNSKITIDIIPVNSNGEVSIIDFQTLLSAGPKPDLVSVMHSNNETGVIQPLKKILSLCHELDIPTHVDFVQSLGKIPFSLRTLKPRYSTFSAHKIGGIKGVGALIIQGEGRLLFPMIHGKQQKSLRGGTENPLGVGFFGKVLQWLSQFKNPETGWLIHNENLQKLRVSFETELKSKIAYSTIHGEFAEKRLPNTTYVGFEGIDGDSVLVNLDLDGIAASSGSACTSGSIDPSHVLLAMGCDKKLARSSIRFSSGIQTQSSDYERVLDVLPEIINRVRKVSRTESNLEMRDL